MASKKRLLSLFLAIILMLSTAVPVYATEVIIEDPTPDTEAPTLTSIAISDNETAVNVPLQLSIEAEDDLSGIANIYAYYTGPDNNSNYVSLYYNSSTLKYEGSITFGSYEGGDWTLNSVTLEDNKDNRRSIYHSTSESSLNGFDFSPYSIHVTGGIVDDIPPVLSSVEFISDSQVGPGGYVTVKADVTDVGSGVSSVYVGIQKPINSTNISLHYNQSSGLYEGSLMIDAYDELGSWNLSNVSLRDYAENYSSYSAARGDFSSYSFEVIGTTPDLIGPTLDHLAISLEQANSSGAVVKLTLGSNDNLSGVGYIYADYQKPNGSTYSVYFSRNYDTGKYEGTVRIDRYDQLGTWKLKNISLRDAKGNYRSIYDQSAGYGEMADFSSFHFTVRGVITIPPAVPFSIGVTPSAVSLKPGDSQNLLTTLYMTDGKTQDVTLGTAKTVYTSSKPTAVKVNENGVITVADNAEPGVVFVQAANSGMTAQTEITISGGTLEEYLQIDPIALRLAPGESSPLQVTAYFKDGTVREVTSGSTGTTYSISGVDGVTIDQNGKVSVGSNVLKGTATIVVTHGEITAESTITVTAPPVVNRLDVAPAAPTVAVGETMQLSIRATLSNGTTKDVTLGSEGTTYVSSNTSMASVDANGLVTVPANAPLGLVIITATNNGIPIKSLVTVDGPRLTDMIITPSTQTVHRGDTLSLSVVGKYSDGVSKNITSSAEETTYMSSSVRRATVDAEGGITIPGDALYGDVTIVVKNRDFSGEMTLSIVEDLSRTVVGLAVTPNSQTVHRGDTLNLSAVATYGNGTTKNVTSGSEGTSYLSGSTRRAVVDANGGVTIPDDALYGEVTVVVKNGEAQAMITLLVEESVTNDVTRLDADPTAQTVHRGDSLNLAVTGTFADNTTKDVTASTEGTTYVSSSSRRAIVDADGHVTIPVDALYGEAIITVKNGKVSTTVTLTIEEDISGRLTSMAASPASQTVHRGDSLDLAVTGTYADNTTKDLTASTEGTTYVSSSTRRANVDAEGHITIPSDALYGEVVITIKNGATVSTTVTLTVEEDTGGNLTSLAASPATQTVHRGDSLNLSVTGTYGDGSNQTLTASTEGTTYVSGSTRRAIVDAEGGVTVPSDALYGDVIITIKNGAVSTTVTLTVEEDISGKLVSMAANPATQTVHRGNSLNIVVTGTYGNGTSRTITASTEGTTYLSGSTRKAIVDAEGRVTIPSDALYGDVIITIKNGTVSTTVTLTVAEDTSNKLVSITATITPATLTARRGDSLIIAVTGTYGSGTSRSITASTEGTTYVSSNARRATVDAEGRIAIPANATYGEVIITIKNGTLSTTIRLNVTA
ncbi:nucleoid-associated protein YgaU [Paenibacillus phyllosphaerae]|uniref:Nucleoid-associated protein YgaU n=1 Tax=Paenibacillus phyllosphaerae TaxID=274593 RepID=A0A7W5B4X8_9BACL|nr:Ig-like domain-containing protein [Paenibacillus phyllosphaerae]MBB3114249.1 nucleoid-associated protein YgaU [Paenibacillus phyllosphaerae]